MPNLVQYGKVQKLCFTRQEEVLDIPNLIEVQKASYDWFLQAGSSGNRLRQGLHGVFLDIFPIHDFAGNLILEYVNYSLGLGRCKKCPGLKAVPEEPCRGSDCTYPEKSCEIVEIGGIDYRIKYSNEECRKRDATFGVPLQLRLRLINKTTGEVKEQEIFIVNLPIMTERGTFIINGAERVVVSQLHRSPGVYFAYDRDKKYYTAKIIPYRGAWLEWELDILKDIISIRIDRKRKQPVTVLLRALGFESDDEILALFNGSEYIRNTIGVDKTKNAIGGLKDIHSKLRPGEIFVEENARAMLDGLFFNYQRYDLGEVGRYKVDKKLRLHDRITKKRAGQSIYDPATGELLVEPGQIISRKMALKIESTGIPSVRIIALSGEELVVENEQNREDVQLYKAVYLASAVTVDGNTLLGEGCEINGEALNLLQNAGINQADVLVGSALHKGRNIEDIRKDINELMVENMEGEETLKRALFGRFLVEDIRDASGKLVDILDSNNSKIGQAKAGAEMEENLWNTLIDRGISKVSLNKGRVLSVADIVAVTRYLIDLCNGLGHEDDIDHLANRRIRRSGELLTNQIRASLSKLERDIRERMTIQDMSQITPQILINTRTIAAVVNDFFASSQLSQFMDQTNPLSELTHKRRVSALGPGGVKRERAGYEVRDVHPTHYGRICPIETPEGPNAGLISSLCVYARINDFGFVETPFREVLDKKVSKEVEYLDAYDEDEYFVSPSDVKINEKGLLSQELLPVKYHSGLDHEFGIVGPDDVDYVRVSPKQMVSIAAALIPFLEHDDANRALMGTNMQRQAVPLVETEAPLVGTGMEYRTAVDSGSVVTAKNAGEVVFVDSENVIVLRDDVENIFKVASGEYPRLVGKYLAQDIKAASETLLKRGDILDITKLRKLADKKISQIKVGRVDRYKLMKFTRSNQATCINQKAIVDKGQKVAKGDVLADGPATENGFLALGRNIVVAFMSWEGCNFEDAILLSERLVKDDLFSSIHIEEYEIEARDTRLGAEDITRDIPGVSSDSLKNLDEDGIIMVGAEVQANDILVGKVTPKGETELTPEDKLLRAIFGEKARDVRNTSFNLPHGEGGKVVEVNVFSRDNKDELSHDVNKMVRVFIAQRRRVLEGDKMAGRHGNKGVIAKIMPVEDMPVLPDGRPVDIVLNPLGVPSRMNLGQVLETHLGYVAKVLGHPVDTPVFAGAREKDIFKNLVLCQLLEQGKTKIYNRINKEKTGYLSVEGLVKDDLLDTILSGEIELFEALAQLMAKKGARLLEVDGFTPIAELAIKDKTKIIQAFEKGDLTQIFKFKNFEIKMAHEEVLYEVAKTSDGYKKVKSKIKGVMYDNGTMVPQKPESTAFRFGDVDIIEGEMGKQTLFDGRDGRSFLNDVMTGWIYMMKLAHLVDDKIHARATGPYSLVTQQPLGGKAQFGGQRFGEMEVWALEAYGAAYTLQELLTVKSDDTQGRVEVYETIIKGHNIMKANIPESFKVLVSELQSLGLKIELLKIGTDGTIEKPDAEYAPASVAF